MPENYGFCPACGSNLPDGAAFCPDCGAILGGGESSFAGSAPPSYAPASTGTSAMPSGLKVAYVATIIYAIATILISLSLLSTMAVTGELDEIFIEEYGKDFETYMGDLGISITIEELEAVCLAGGIVGLMSAALSIAAAVLCSKGKGRVLAASLIALASLVHLGLVMGPMAANGIMNVIIGLIMAAIVFTSKGYFTS